MYNGLSNAHLYAAVRVVAEFRVPGLEDTKTSAGTAFFVRNARGYLCLVTNRHVVDMAYADTSGKFRSAALSALSVIAFIADKGNVSAKPTVRHTAKFLVGASPIRFATNYDEDLACIVNPVFDPSTSSASGATIDFYFDHTALADDTWIDNHLSVCDFVVFPGYPPWHDKLEGRPILRTGTISSDPRANYSDTNVSKGRRVAYEAFSFGGSSGSPVIATEKGIIAGNGIATTGYREGRLVGVNAGHLPGDYGAHSGISYFIKSSAVLELIA